LQIPGCGEGNAAESGSKIRKGVGMDKLNEPEIERALQEVPDWNRSGDSITRTFTLPGFPDAIMFAAAAGNLAQRADHHPDILIQYKKVTFTLSTHSAGGLTTKDFALAKEISDIAR
jgi:4a-hydroxytetrahydrobiopterin dehydratase